MRLNFTFAGNARIDSPFRIVLSLPETLKKQQALCLGYCVATPFFLDNESSPFSARKILPTECLERFTYLLYLDIRGHKRLLFLISQCFLMCHDSSDLLKICALNDYEGCIFEVIQVDQAFYLVLE